MSIPRTTVKAHEIVIANRKTKRGYGIERQTVQSITSPYKVMLK